MLLSIIFLSVKFLSVIFLSFFQLPEMCRTTAYFRELPYYMLRCNVIVNVMVVSCIHKHKINLNWKLQRRNDWSFFVEQWAWFVVRLQVWPHHFLNRIGIVRFEFELNLDASQVPTLIVYRPLFRQPLFRQPLFRQPLIWQPLFRQLHQTHIWGLNQPPIPPIEREGISREEGR